MKILVADDETVQLHMLQRLLERWGHEVISVTDGRQAWSVLTGDSPPAMAILDWIMPEMNGVQVCRALRDLPDRQYTYVLLLTSLDAKNNLVGGLEAGADDFLSKPFNSQELKARLIAGKRILDLQEQLLQANRRLQIQASYDALTGLLNRGAILELLLNEFARSRREKKPVGIILADIDHFKAINDGFGHSAGDIVLRQVAQTIRSVTRSYDLVGRYGGEEFLIVLPGCGDQSCYEKAEQIRNCVARESFQVGHSEKLVATLSLGCVSVCAPADYQLVLDRADNALYEAKRQGRNQTASAYADTPI